MDFMKVTRFHDKLKRKEKCKKEYLTPSLLLGNQKGEFQQFKENTFFIWLKVNF
jgi:hypothetical protein